MINFADRQNEIDGVKTGKNVIDNNRKLKKQTEL